MEYSNGSCPDGLESCGSQMPEFLSSDLHYPPILRFQLIVLGLSSLVGVVGNSIVVGVIALRSSLRTTPNLYILNRSVVNILNCLLTPVLITSLINGAFNYGPVACKLSTAVGVVSIMMDGAIFAMMSIDCHLESRKRGPSSRSRLGMLRAAVAVTWLSASLLGVPLYIFTRYSYQEPYGGKCTERLLFYVSFPYLFILGVLVIFLVPFVVIWISLFLTCVSGIIRGGGGDLEDESRRRRRLMLALAVAFSVCQLPYWFVYVDLHTGFVVPSYGDYIYVTIPLLDINYALNALICIFCHQDLRAAIFCLKRSPVEFEPLEEITHL